MVISFQNMLQTIDDVRQGFFCPECHQDMSNKEMLQVHFQNVHMKQPVATGKGFFSLAKQKMKSVQDNLKTSNEPIKPYAQYFHDYSSKQLCIGYSHSHSDYFGRIRKDKVDHNFTLTSQLLLRMESLINTDAHVPRNGNSKERQKYEQDIVRWMEDSVASLCASCSKPFGIFKRKHHCRLDGSVICNPCSHFISFAVARYLINPNVSPSLPTNGITYERLTSLTSITSTATVNDGPNEDSVRMCSSCKKYLQRRHDQIRFQKIAKDEVFQHYEKIIETQKEFDSIYPTYCLIIDSLLSGDTKYQITDAQREYRQINACYDKIDSTSKLIAKLADSFANMNEHDKTSVARYSAVCRSIRMYSIQLVQNCAISTRRVPSEDDVKQVRATARQRFIDEQTEYERIAKAKESIKITSNKSSGTTASGWNPTVDRNLMKLAEEFDPMAQQHYQVVQFIKQAEKAGRYDEVKILEINLKELEEAMIMAKQR